MGVALKASECRLAGQPRSSPAPAGAGRPCEQSKTLDCCRRPSRAPTARRTAGHRMSPTARALPCGVAWEGMRATDVYGVRGGAVPPGRPPRRPEWPRGPHLLIVHTVVVIVFVTGVPGAVLVEVFLPRVREQRAVVLRAQDARELQMLRGHRAGAVRVGSRPQRGRHPAAVPPDREAHVLRPGAPGSCPPRAGTWRAGGSAAREAWSRAEPAGPLLPATRLTEPHSRALPSPQAPGVGCGHPLRN